MATVVNIARVDRGAAFVADIFDAAAALVEHGAFASLSEVREVGSEPLHRLAPMTPTRPGPGWVA